MQHEPRGDADPLRHLDFGMGPAGQIGILDLIRYSHAEPGEASGVILAIDRTSIVRALTDIASNAPDSDLRRSLWSLINALAELYAWTPSALGAISNPPR